MYFSIVNFSWEGDARDTLTGIGFIHECSNEGHIYTYTLWASSRFHDMPLRTIGCIRSTLQGAKKNSSRKASTFRQVTTKRTCERAGAGWQGWSLSWMSPGSRDRVTWPSHVTARDCNASRDYLLDHVLPGSMVGQCGWLYVFWWAGEESWRVLTIRTCASRRNRATKDQLPPFSISPSTVNDDAADRGTTRNVAARTSRLADVRSGDHAGPRMKNLATRT